MLTLCYFKKLFSQTNLEKDTHWVLVYVHYLDPLNILTYNGINNFINIYVPTL